MTSTQIEVKDYNYFADNKWRRDEIHAPMGGVRDSGWGPHGTT